MGAQAEPTPQSPKDPRFQKQWSFDLEYRDARGKLWVGQFTNQILNLRQRTMVGVMRAKMAAGLPADSLDPVTAELNLMVSHLAYSLVKAPDWATDLLGLDDQELVGQIFDRVSEHETFFRTGQPAPAAGQGGSE